MTNTCIFIPSRLKATRLPNKPILTIGNKPMICHVVDRAKEANIGEVVVATDSYEILQILENYNTKCVMTDPNHQSGSDRIFEALEKVDPHKNLDFVINLQGDMPFIHADSIRTLHKFDQKSKADINTLVTQLTAPDKIAMKSVTKVAISFKDLEKTWGQALYFSREAIPYNSNPYYEHLGIYAFKRESLKKFINLPPSPLELLEKLEQLRALENDMTINVTVVNDHPISVDVQEDLDMAIDYFEKNKNKL
jgi:3-deoxy-manno-octulosonate cytidylyltransferase (CMP-KDO synthetase)